MSLPQPAHSPSGLSRISMHGSSRVTRLSLWCVLPYRSLSPLLPTATIATQTPNTHTILIHHTQITAILFQLPSGVANGGLFSFVSASDDDGQSSNEVYLSGFQTALQLVSVGLGLTVGLGVSLVLVFPIESKRRKAGVFSL